MPSEARVHKSPLQPGSTTPPQRRNRLPKQNCSSEDSELIIIENILFNGLLKYFEALQDEGEYGKNEDEKEGPEDD